MRGGPGRAVTTTRKIPPPSPTGPPASTGRPRRPSRRRRRSPAARRDRGRAPPPRPAPWPLAPRAPPARSRTRAAPRPSSATALLVPPCVVRGGDRLPQHGEVLDEGVEVDHVQVRGGAANEHCVAATARRQEIAHGERVAPAPVDPLAVRQYGLPDSPPGALLRVIPQLDPRHVPVRALPCDRVLQRLAH